MDFAKIILLFLIYLTYDIAKTLDERSQIDLYFSKAFQLLQNPVTFQKPVIN